MGAFTLRDDSWYVHRLPVFVPVAAAYAALGVHAWTTHAGALLYSLLELVFTTWLGMRLLGRPAGLLAAALLATLPLSAEQAGRLMPDGPMASLLTVAAASWLLGRERAGGRSSALMVLSGVCLSLAIIVRTYAVLLAILYVGDILMRPRTLRDLVWPALGGLLVIAPLLAAYRMATGDVFYPIHVVSSAYGQQLAPQAAGDFLDYPSILWHPRTDLALHAWLFVGGLAFALARRSRAHVLLVLWALPLLLFLEFGTMSFHAYVPIFKDRRFLTVVASPLCMLAGSMLAALAPRLRAWLTGARRNRAVRAAVIVGLLLVGLTDALFVLRRDHDEIRGVARQTRSVVALLSAEPRLPIVVDHWRTASRLAYSFDYREGSNVYVGANDRLRIRRREDSGLGRFQYLAWYRNPSRLPESFVVLEDSVLALAARADSNSTGPFFVGEVPAYAYTPPPSWQLVRRIGTWRVYRTPPARAAAPLSFLGH
jgi:4-amino-4-deoxy-L-arabinose transferase-like glycosyltransferase